MKPFKKVGFISLIVLALFVLMPFSYAQDEEDFINVSPVEKKDTGEMMDSGAVVKAEKPAPTPAPQAEAEKPAAKPAVEASGVRVEKVVTIDLPDRVEVRIMTSAPVKYKATELNPPPSPRILVQINNCAVSGETKPAGVGSVDKIRTAPHNSTAWIVVDLKEKTRWNVTSAGSRITVSVPKSGKPAVTEAAAAPEETVAEPARPSGSMIYRVIEVASKNIGKKTRTIVTTDGPVKYRIKKDGTGRTITLDIVDAVSIWQKGSFAVEDSTVKNVSLKENSAGKTVAVTLSLSENAPYTVNRDQNQVIIDVDNPDMAGKKSKKRLDLYQKISLNVQDASLTGVLRLLSTQTGFEFSVSPNVTKASPVTIREEDKTLNQVLKDVLMPQNLFFEVVDGVIKVGDIMELKAAKQLQAKRSKYYTPRTMKAEELKAMLDTSIQKEPLMDVVIQIDKSQGVSRLMMFGVENDIDKVSDMISGLDAGGSGDDVVAEGGYKTRIFKLQYIYPSTVVETVKTFLSTDGKAIADDRSGNLIVTDNVTYLKKLDGIIKKLDVKLRQVIIEAKLYEVDVAALRDIGVKWSAESQSSQPHIVGEVSPPTAVSGAGSLAIGLLTNGFKIDAQLDALETQSKASLLSSPKIAVGDNSKAKIETTRTTYYQQTKIQEQANAAPVISTEYVPVTLPITLEVAAKLTENNTIMMNVDLAVAKILSASTGNAPPETTNQKATTLVTAQNNETVVIGGLISETVTMKQEKVPLLGDLPLIGGLFSGTKDEKQKVELVVFLTPSIIDEE